MLKASILATALTLGLASASQAAVPGPVSLPQDDIIKVSGGCGPYAFRTPDGFCRPIRPVFRPRVCPPGFHPGGYGRCFPNR